jgi:hypothetical protein
MNTSDRVRDPAVAIVTVIVGVIVGLTFLFASETSSRLRSVFVCRPGWRLVDEQLRQLGRCTDHDGVIVDFYLHIGAAFVAVRCLIQAARHTNRWDTRPATRRLR